jgi:Voltage gated chloride channel
LNPQQNSALIVTFLVSTFAPEAKGHGVPEVMDAIYYGGGLIRPVVAVVKSLASAIAIGTGAAVGREGPIIQIGAALGSTLGQIVRMSAGERIILVASGAGAGIAATFNTPIGGVVFAIELMMPEVSARTFLPVAIGVLRINTPLRHTSEAAQSTITFHDIASRSFAIVREDDIVFDVIQRMSRKQATMALVVRGLGVPRPRDVVGVITKEHVADSVVASIKVYPARC